MIKEILLGKLSCFPEPRTNKSKTKAELGLSNYATKSHLKNATGVDTSQFAKNADLAGLKSEADKLDVDELKNVPNGLNSLKSKVDKLDVDKLKRVLVDLKKLNDEVDNDNVKTTVYDELVKKVNSINTSRPVKKAGYDNT